MRHLSVAWESANMSKYADEIAARDGAVASKPRMMDITLDSHGGEIALIDARNARRYLAVVA